MNGGCTHLDQIHDVTPSSWGCEDCLAQGRQDWVHLRVCQECGHVGCCDNSPGGTQPRTSTWPGTRSSGRPRSLLTVVALPVSRIGLVAAGAIFFANFAAYTYIGPLLHTGSALAPARSRWCCSGSAWPARPATSPRASPYAGTCGPP
jgi:hypothetical protein